MDHPIPRAIIRMWRTPATPPYVPGVAPYGAEDELWIKGFCMRCSEDALVMQVGDLAGAGAHMPFFVCRDCRQELSVLLRTWQQVRDGVADRNALRKVNIRFRLRRRARFATGVR